MNRNAPSQRLLRGAAAGAVATAPMTAVMFAAQKQWDMLGQWLGAHAPHRLTRLVLANTSPRIADPAGMETRRQTVLAQGTAAVVETAMTRFFVPSLIAANPPHVATARGMPAAANPMRPRVARICMLSYRSWGGAAGVRTGTPRALMPSRDAEIVIFSAGINRCGLA